MSNDLIKVESIVPEKAFVKNGLARILSDVEKQIKPLVFDISTEKGRKELSSVCYKIKRTKTAIDGLGKEYVSALKKLPKVVDAERKRAREFLEQLESDVRRPLTEWEESEEKRKNEILARINAIDPFQGGIISVSVGQYSMADLKAMEAKANGFIIDGTLGEYKESGAKRKEEILLKLSGLIAMQEKHEAEQAALEKERQEKLENERIAREERIAKEAAEKAKREAEEKAEAERQAIIKREQEAREAALRAEREKIEAEERAERARVAAEKRAEEEKQAAIQAERDRIESEAAAKRLEEYKEKKEAERKAANKQHRAKINNEAANAIVLAMSEVDSGNAENAENIAKAVVTAIAKGEIPNVSINY